MAIPPEGLLTIQTARIFFVERDEKKIVVWRDGRCLRCGIEHHLSDVLLCKRCGALLCDRQVKRIANGRGPRRHHVNFVHSIYRKREQQKFRTFRSRADQTLEETACGPCVLLRFEEGKEFVSPKFVDELLDLSRRTNLFFASRYGKTLTARAAEQSFLGLSLHPREEDWTFDKNFEKMVIKSHRAPPPSNERCKRCGKFHRSDETYRCTECGAYLCLDQVWSEIGAPVGEQMFHNVYDPEYVTISQGRNKDGSLGHRMEHVKKCGPCVRVYE